MLIPETILCPVCHKTNRPAALRCQHCGQDMILNNDMPDPNDDRRYVITHIIKEGGQGAIYKGVDQRGQVYAIKEMLDNFADASERADAVKRFNAEAIMLQRLNHPRIPRVYSHFVDEGRYYLTMDFVQGEDLEDIVKREGPIPEAQVLVWADQICDVLTYLHNNGLIYRDMKPSNVMIEKDGNVKVVDFGIAKVFTPDQRGTQIGTPGYAPPEQYQGLATKASDIYGLAATLHHLLTGRDPTEHPPFTFEPVRNLNINVTRRTSDAIQKGLSLSAEDRFATVVEFRSMLRPLPGTSQPLHGSQPLSPSSPAKTIAIPQSVSTPSTPSKPPQAAPPPPSTAHPRLAAPVPAAPPKQPNKGGCMSRSCVMWAIGIALLLIVGSGGVVLFFLFQQMQPPWSIPTTSPTPTTAMRPTVASITIVPPTVVSPSQVRATPPSSFFSQDIEIVVDRNADEATIRQQFLDTLVQQLRQQYGDDIEVYLQVTSFLKTGDSNTLDWQKVGEEGNTIRYRATIQTRISRK